MRASNSRTKSSAKRTIDHLAPRLAFLSSAGPRADLGGSHQRAGH